MKNTRLRIGGITGEYRFLCIKQETFCIVYFGANFQLPGSECISMMNHDEGCLFHEPSFTALAPTSLL